MTEREVLGAGIANAPSGGWRTATVAGVRRPIQRSVELRLDVADRVDHLPGQHYVVRLTAEDGYTAQRSYSVASAPGDPLVELFIERLDDGEVSDVPRRRRRARRRAGGPRPDRRLVRLGRRDTGAAGGRRLGVVPFVAMLRHAKALGREDLLRIAVSSRTLAELPYADEVLEAGALVVLTREAHGIRPAGRLTAGELVPLWEPGQTAYVCGSASFAESASRILVDLGIPAADIRVERFGPSGAPA